MVKYYAPLIFNKFENCNTDVPRSSILINLLSPLINYQFLSINNDEISYEYGVTLFLNKNDTQYAFTD